MKHGDPHQIGMENYSPADSRLDDFLQLLMENPDSIASAGRTTVAAGSTLKYALVKSLAQWAEMVQPLIQYGQFAEDIPGGTAQALVDAAKIRRAEPLLLQLQRQSVDLVLNGTEWLTAPELGAIANPNAHNSQAHAKRLLKQHRVFAIEHRGQQLFPRYAVDEKGQPYPVVADLIGLFNGWSPLRLASWLESTNSMLDGKRPRELVASNPGAVREAAERHLTGPVHG